MPHPGVMQHRDHRCPHLPRQAADGLELAIVDLGPAPGHRVAFRHQFDPHPKYSGRGLTLPVLERSKIIFPTCSGFSFFSLSAQSASDSEILCVTMGVGSRPCRESQSITSKKSPGVEQYEKRTVISERRKSFKFSRTSESKYETATISPPGLVSSFAWAKISP